MNLDELPYQIGLTLIEGIGDVHAKSLVAYCGSSGEVFRHKKSQLLKVPGIGEYLARSISNSKEVLKRAEQEIKFIEKYRIVPLFFTDEHYPARLKCCSDSPVMLYYKGSANLNSERIVAVVGSRKPSEYGREKTRELIEDLRAANVMIVSGLAYGVDVLAHKTALDEGLETVGVLAHGLDRMYPKLHEKIAKRMLAQGGLLTDFISGTNPDAVNFPKRNRIVAALCDALVVVESKRQGGSLITATIANSYNKDVFAYPGRGGDPLAEGCNGLIKQNKASLVENAADLLYGMQWEEKHEKKQSVKQTALLLNLSEEEKLILKIFDSKSQVQIDELCYSTQMPVSKIASLLLQMEFSNLIKSKPGKMYERA